MKWTLLCLLSPLVLVGCSSSSCSCAPISVNLRIPDSVAADVENIDVGGASCGTAIPQCVARRGNRGCASYAINLVGSGQVNHTCDVTVTLAGGRTSTTQFTWRVDPDGCCGIRTFKPGYSVDVPLPVVPDGGARD